MNEFLEAAERSRRRRVARRRLTLAIVLLVLSGVSVAFAWLAADARDQRDRARIGERRAVDETVEALREGARSALARGQLLEARAKLRGAAEVKDDARIRALWGQVAADPRVWQLEVGQNVAGLELSPDGRTLAMCDEDGSIRLLDGRTGRQRDALESHPEDCAEVAWDASGRRLVAGGPAQVVKVWDVARGRLEHTLGPVSDFVTAVAFADDESVVAATRAGEVVEWQLGGGEGRSLFHTSWARSVTLATRGRWLAASGARPIELYDRVAHTRRTFDGHTGRVRVLAFDPSGSTLASGGVDGSLWLWDAASGAELGQLEGHTNSIIALAFGGGDGRLLASAGRDGIIRLFDVERGTLVRTLPGHADRVSALSFDAAGRFLASAGYDAFVRLWDVEAPGAFVSRGHQAPVWQVAFSPDGALLATAGGEGLTRLIDVATGQERDQLASADAPAAIVRFHPDGRRLLTGGGGGRLTLWDLATSAPDAVLQRSDARMRDASFLSDRTFVTLDTEAVTRWELHTGRALTFDARLYSTMVAGFDGDKVALSSPSGEIDVWDLEALASLPTGTSTAQGGPWSRRLDGSASIYALGADPRGNRLVSAGDDGSVRLWDLASGTSHLVWQDPGEQVLWAAVHPTRELVGFGLRVRPDAMIVDLERGRALRLRGHAGFVASVAFSPDGTHFATAGADGTARLWDVATGARAGTALGCRGRRTCS